MSSPIMMSRMYAGLPKPGHAVFEGATDPALRRPLTQVRSRFVARYLGVELVSVPSAGVADVNGRMEPAPVAVLTDLLQAIPGAPGGLVTEGPGEEPWVAATRLLLGALESRGVVTVLPSDQHLHPDLLRRDAPTGYALVESLLHPEEKARLARMPALAGGRGARLTLGEYEGLFGNVVDKEDRNFLPHCREGVVEYIPSVLGMLSRQRARVQRAWDAGEAAPEVTVVPDFKTGLSCLSAPDARGLHGNLLRDVLLATQQGLYLDGDARPHAKLAIVGGTAHEYSVAELVRFLVDMDYSVVWMLACTGGLGIDAKLSTVMDLCERYGTRVFATYGWPFPAHLGAEPAGFSALAAQVRAADMAELTTFEAARAQRVTSMKTSMGRPLVVDAPDLARMRAPGSAP